MELIEQHRSHAGQLWTAQQLLGEDTVSLEKDGGLPPAAAVKADLVADPGAESRARLGGDPGGEAARGEPPGLEHEDFSGHGAEEKLGRLRRLSAAGGGRQDEAARAGQLPQYAFSKGLDWEGLLW